MKSAPIKLDPPGAGIPWAHKVYFRLFVLPKIRKIPLEEIRRRIEKQKSELERLAANLTGEQRREQVLVPRLRGLEDSSRFWSCEMVFEHLLIVHAGMLGIVSTLQAGREVGVDIRIGDLKPKARLDWNDAVENWAKTYQQIFALDINAPATSVKKNHPWFGPLDWRDWYRFFWLHSGVHLAQLKIIQERLLAGARSSASA